MYFTLMMLSGKWERNIRISIKFYFFWFYSKCSSSFWLSYSSSSCTPEIIYSKLFRYLSKFQLAFKNNRFISLFKQKKLVLSANTIGFRNCDTKHKSFMESVKKNGPKIDSCVTPHIMYKGSVSSRLLYLFLLLLLLIFQYYYNNYYHYHIEYIAFDLSDSFKLWGTFIL